MDPMEEYLVGLKFGMLDIVFMLERGLLSRTGKPEFRMFMVDLIGSYRSAVQGVEVARSSGNLRELTVGLDQVIQTMNDSRLRFSDKEMEPYWQGCEGLLQLRRQVQLLDFEQRGIVNPRSTRQVLN